MNATQIDIETRDPATARIAQIPLTTETSNTSTRGPVVRLCRRRKQMSLGLAVGVLILVAAYAGWRWWGYAHTWTTTDNAYVSGHIHTVSTRIAGSVEEVFVNENQTVAAGELLARLDSRDLEVRCEQARSLLAQGEAQITQAAAQVAREEAVATRAQLDFNRADQLRHGAAGAISQQEFDNAKAVLEGSQAALAAARAAVRAAQAQKQVAAANLADAELQLSYTKIVAPASGRIGRKNVEVGNRVQPGQALLAIVQPEVWVTANFKETQLKRLQPGQAVKLSVDSFPGHDFAGRVESIAPASGAQFALLPPDNATGNFTRIVQRVPVKIVFDEEGTRDCAGKIVPGMSVVVKVNVRS